MSTYLLNVPNPEPKSWRCPEPIYNLVDVIVSHISKVNTEIKMLVGRLIIQKIKQAKLNSKKFYFNL